MRTLNNHMSISFGSCIAGGRTTQHGVKCDDYKDNITFILDLQASGKATSCHANLKLCISSSPLQFLRIEDFRKIQGASDSETP